MTERVQIAYSPVNNVHDLNKEHEQEEEQNLFYVPSPPAMTLPKSPAWRFWSVGAPWSFFSGLKWGPKYQKGKRK